MNALQWLLIWMLGFCILMSGCATQVKQDQPETTHSSSDESKSIDLEDCILTRAVVTYYLSEGRTYLTDQQHIFCPEEESLQIHPHRLGRNIRRG